ncbi:MAG: TraB/GumN family protein [Dysgonamonadaceae bacterium]|jgi:uncharacterized protein YbaP (TraB family)|nr:TraB/GumN family protein [Dysgonamonadaceae bacterium]
MNFKKQTFIILLVICVLTLQSFALENSLLWKVSGNGLTKPSYIFGTHHLIPLSFLDTVNGLNDAFEQTEQTVGEVDMSNMLEMQMQMMQHAMMPEGVTYQSLLSEDDFMLLDSTLTSLTGTGLAQMGQLKPTLLGLSISVLLYQRYYPETASGENLDIHFQQEAVKRSRPAIGLESIENQIHVLFEISSIERQAESLMCMIKHPEMLKEMIDNLHELYFAHNINALYELWKEDANSPCVSTEEERNALNKDRNLRWLDKLPAIMSEKSSFIAVGALHLPGEDGLIEGLRRLGYTVEAVK